MKNILLLLAIVFASGISYAQCNNTSGGTYARAPVYPEPDCSLGTTALNSASTSITSTGNYRIPAGANPTITSFSLNSGTTNIYVCPGASIQFNQWNVNSGAALNIYVLNGSTIKFNTDLTRGNVYVYGKLQVVLDPNNSAVEAFQVQNTALLSVATTGIVDISKNTFDLTSSTVGLFNDGGAIFAKKMTMQSSTAPVFCMAKAACTSISLDLDNTVTDAIFADPGTTMSYLNLTQTSAQTTSSNNSVNNRVSSSSNLTVCQSSGVNYTHSGASPWPSATPSTSCGAGASAKCNIALPVSLLYFNGQKSREGVTLNWATSKQWNSQYFIIEKSSDGIHWETLTTVNSEKNNTTLSEYSVQDHSPVSGYNYYKLSEVDVNGNKTEYSVTSVKADYELGSYTMYPNPSSGDLHIKLFGESPSYEFELFDVSGKKILKTKLIMGLNTLEDAFPSPGVYIAKLKVGFEVKTEKIIVQ